MLQQTPVARVLPVARRLAGALADARPRSPPSRPARRSGCGVGSATRAGRCGCTPPPSPIVERHDGEVPASYDELLALPGVGDYTAAAVASFAFGRRHVVLDTNVRRVLRAGRVGGSSSRRASVTRAERDLATGAAARRRGHRRHLGGRGDGARRPGLHRARPALRRPARSPTGARGWRPAARRTTVPRAAGRPGPAPTASAAAGSWPCCATPRAPSARPRSRRCGPAPSSATAAWPGWSRTAWSRSSTAATPCRVVVTIGPGRRSAPIVTDYPGTASTGAPGAGAPGAPVVVRVSRSSLEAVGPGDVGRPSESSGPSPSTGTARSSRLGGHVGGLERRQVGAAPRPSGP